MKRSGGFAVVELLIILVIVAIVCVTGYYVFSRNHKTLNNPSVKSSQTTSSSKTNPSPPAPPADKSTLKISEFGIKLVNVPKSIQDMYYTYYPANTESNYTGAQFTTTSLTLKNSNCSIGELDKYPGKYNASSYQGQAEFIKQFGGFWVAEVGEGVPCEGSKSVMDLQNSQTTTFKQYVTNPDNLQVIL